MKIDQFTDLDCWKTARTLVKLIYQVTNTGSFLKDFALRDQIRRSAISIMANIAEGFGTQSDSDFIRFFKLLDSFLLRNPVAPICCS